MKPSKQIKPTTQKNPILRANLDRKLIALLRESPCQSLEIPLHLRQRIRSLENRGAIKWNPSDNRWSVTAAAAKIVG